MRTGAMWRFLLAAIVVLSMAGHSCTDTRNAGYYGYDALDGIMDILDSGTGQAVLPASGDPAITIVDPSNGKYFALSTPVTPVTVTVSVTNWEPYPEDGKSIVCFLDGEEQGSAESEVFQVPDVPLGMHTITCQLWQNGEALKNCEATDSILVKVYKSCTADSQCEDGNPCSVDACVTVAGGLKECRWGLDIYKPDCCMSAFDCACSEEITPSVGAWEICSSGTCVECDEENPCEDYNECTEDVCVNGSCTFEWITTDLGKCCSADATDPDAACDDGLYCTVDYCNLAAGHCVNEDSGDPGCCENDPDPKCDDDDICTIDKCLNHECRHGSVADPDCCNDTSECDDGNPCTDDECVGDSCVYTENNADNCCNEHADCSTGGDWDDDDPSTIDYCKNFQCIHVADPLYCECVTGCEYPVTDDGNLCTEEECLNNHMKWTPVPGCCTKDGDCSDKNVCTSDTCVDNACVYEDLNAGLGEIVCCNVDSECEDDSVCTIDVCINHECRHGSDASLPDCCMTDNDCVDGIACTSEYCNLDTNTCVYNLVPDQTPKCCWEASTCDDGDPYTVDKCVKNVCKNLAGIICTTDSQCNDSNPCTTDTCDTQAGLCKYTIIQECCTTDASCGDGDVCTTDKCVANGCTHTPVTECCSSKADCTDGGTWDDGDLCTTDSCVGNACKHVAIKGCCIDKDDCDDGNDCTADTCFESLCKHTVDYATEGCCGAHSDCYDVTLPCKDYLCIDNQCDYTDKDQCCEEPEEGIEAPECDDLNECTCDVCLFDKCRHLGPDQAPAECALPLNCCTVDQDCEQPSDPCKVATCNDTKHTCEIADVPNCAQELPYSQTFNSCSSLASLGWTVVDKGASAESNWKCSALGDLGPDNHERFDWDPQVGTYYDSYLVTPPLDAAGLTAVTVQYDREYSHFENATDLGLYVIVDTAADGPTADDDFLAVWDTTKTSDIEAENVQYKIPGGYLSDSLYVGFRVSGTNTYDLNYFDLDNVKVCAGVSPTWDKYPTSIAVEVGDTSTSTLWIDDDDPNDDLEWSVISGPDFISLTDPVYYYYTKNHQGKLIVTPTSDDEAGLYEVVLRVSDGCLSKDITIDLQVLVADGYVVWNPSGVPSAHADAIADAIEANDRTVQVVTDLTVFENLNSLAGIFITLGVYGSKYELTAADVLALTKYLDVGGKVYMEGGDTWAFDTWTNLQPYFRIEPLDDGDQSYVGSIAGRHFCWNQDFAVSTDYTVNNFVDQIDKKLQTKAVPILTDSTGDFHLGVAFEHATKKYRTIGTSLPFKGLLENGKGTLNELMGLYIYFFENGYPPCTTGLQCNDSVACTDDSCYNSECINADQPDCIVCVDDQDCPDLYACDTISSNICKAIPYTSYEVSADTPKTIAASSANKVTSVINVAEGFPVQDVNVKVYIQHYYRGDLEITLEHGGATVTLVAADPTDSDANFYYTYDFGAESPEDIKAAFEGLTMNGNWTLTVNDKAAVNGGQLLGWELYIVYEVPACEENADCDDGKFCTDDSCDLDLGYCQFVEKSCDDDDLCTDDSCDEVAGQCVNTANVDCDDGNECTADSCNALTGECDNEVVDNCSAQCTTHADCGANDYCDPAEGICKPIPGDVYQPMDVTFPASIPDNAPTDLVSKITVTGDGFLKNIYVKVLITHGYKGDLTVQLTGKNSNKTITLHNQSGGAGDNIYAVYDLVETPDGAADLSAFEAGNFWAADTWTLTVHDWVTGDAGTLDDWRIFLNKDICTVNTHCDDGDACTIDVCAAGVCSNDALPCDDGSWCNGEETCDQVLGCVAGTPQQVDDNISCTADFCDEASESVKHVPQNAQCNDGLWCNGSETCDPAQGCVAGTPPSTEDGVDCTVDQCDEDGKTIQHVAVDALCDDDLFCNGIESCDAVAGCQPGSAPDTDDGIDCTVDACDEDGDVITHTVTHALCNDGAFCNGAELCDTELGCVSGEAPLVSDGIACTLDECDEGTDTILHTPQDASCNDGLYCNGLEECVEEIGCVTGTPPVLTDGVFCTIDTCDEGTDSVVHTPDSNACVYDGSKDAECVLASCDEEQGCIFLDNNGLGCEDGEACTVDDTCQGGYCVGGGASDAPECQCTTNEECEDGDKCNGIMECVAGVCQLQLDSVVTCGDASGQCYKLVCIPETGACEEQPVQAGTACDDGSICTVEDVCDGNGTCEGAANACDDGYFCNGEEVCNPVTGECSAGTPPTLSDGVGCTVDKCDEVNDVITHTANDDYCADGIFCNGPEYCDAVEGCKHEGLSLDDGIACTVDSCDEENDIVLHEPDNSQCNDGQWCNGTEYCSKVNGCMADDVPVLDDGVACTVDTCDEANDEVLHTANHALCTDGNDCNGIEVCDVNVGCKAGVEPDLDDGIDCTIDSCEGGVLKHTPDDSLCNDGKWCNGTETCSALLGCVSVDAPVLSDGVACTQDYCDEALDMVVHKADDTACDNGQYCDGTEYCDAALDCQNGTIPDCGDDDPCTKDICDEALNDGGGACDSSSKVQYCDNTCGGFHAYDAGDNDCGYDDACVGGLAGEGMGDCTPICDADNCAVERSGVIKSPISDYSCVTKFLTIAAPYTYILDVDVKVEVLHANIGDLTVQVVDPAGTVVDLWAVATGGTNDNFYNTFTTSYEDIPGSMCSLQGHKASGMWKLKVCDKAVNNEGYLNSWSLYVATTPDNLGLGDTCEEPIPLASTDGTHDATGTTACANDTYSNSCGGTNGADRVYKFSIAVPKRVTFTVASAFDAIIALKGAEADTCASTTLICKDTCPDDGCTESFSKRLMDVGDYYFFVDSSAFEQGAYTVSATFLTLKDNGEACDASVECLSNYCNNGYCCDEGVCCSGEASSCPPAYDSPSQCTDPAACQGQRQDGTCANFQCSTVAVDDDSGCVGEVANGCGCYLPVICTDEMDQAVASCPTNCTENDDTQCDESCHCSAEDILDLGVCEGDFPDGEACVEDSDCISDNCQNGYCCSGDTCCWTIEDCPPELAEPAVCDSQASCQGHRVEAMCVNSVCDGMSVDDDSACSAGLLADECGYYLSIYCEGGVDQTAPACPESCTVDAECDPDAHCDDVCLPDVENGGECDENSDCVSDYCSNGFCCDGPTGDCCNGDGDSCPADYFETPTCDSPSTCQGSQTGAVCIEFTCVGGTVGNDSECGPDILANACGLYKDIYCTGEKDQPVAACPGSCTLDSECDEPAHCDDICVADLPNGSVCDENSDCISDHCQNGFCCESGDCCSGADETCPEAYYQAPTCDDAANCQGTRLDKLCQDFMCSNEPIADDSGCTTETVSQECGCFAPVYCNGEEAQAAPTCPTTCVGDGDCAETCHCDDTCVPDLDLGEGCDENSDCKSGFCADGVCCSSACDKSCEACDIEGSVGTCTAHAFATDPENDCGLCSQCNGASGCVLVGAGLDPVGDCPAQPENTCQKDGTCDGKGNCRYWVTGTVCGTDSCVGSTKYNADICNGLGTCVDGGTSLCVPYVCNAEETDCLTECDGDEDCVSGYWCNAAGSCVAKQNTGNLCGSELAFGGLGDGSNQCLSDYCIDGYCCNTACSGSCAACNVAGQEGSCAYHAPQTDPEGDCGICMVCNGTGSCTAAVAESDPKDDCAADDPTTCQLDGFCDGTGACRLYLPGTVCGEGFCTVQNGGYDDIENGTKVCDGDGLCIDKGEVICYPYVCNGDLACYDNCITDAECAPDSWCSGAECVLKKDNGETCSGPTAGNECKSDFCVDGVCCENACDGACEACNLTDTEGTCTGHAAQTDPESDCELCFACDGAGGCVSADAGTDPKDECETSSQETCGFDGTCDGAGACRDWIDGTVCKVQECIDWTLHLADTCDGAGTCVDAGTEFCEPYICNGAGSACLTMCEAHGDCFMGYYCDGNQECVQKKELGEPCGEAVECQSDKCVDGFCCASDCTAQCMTCVPAEGHPAGQCHPEADGDDTSGDCPLCEVCDGANACRPADAGTDPKDNCTDEGVATCGFDGTCDGSSACAYYAPDITCAEAYCAEHVAHAEDNCSGDGTCVDGGSTDCSPYQCDDAGLACRTICTEDPHCITTHWCDTFDVADNKCKEKFDNGESCLQATQCKSSFCSPDGVCCDAACDGTCSSCVQAGSVGTCVYFDNDTDPDSECGLCGVCNGSGECKPATGGTDPKGECTATEPVSCGLDGECDGAYACRYWGEQTVCLDQTCVDHTLYPDDVCSGDGSCVDSGEVDCAPYMCNTNDQCRTLCFETAHCVPGYWCDNNNECSYKKPNGYACALDSECISSACVDGYCCDGGCDSTCKTCSGEWNAPYTITVDGSMNGWDLKAHKLGTGASNVKYYFTWDADYMYVAVQGVDLGTDKIFIAFDEDLTPDVGSGASGLFGGVTFEGDRRPEYAIAFSGMEDISYVPHDGGGAWDAAQPVGNQWSHYAGWADNKVSEIAIPRAYLGALDPDVGFAMWVWANNNAETYVWSIWPDTNTIGVPPLSLDDAQFVRDGAGMCVFHTDATDPEYECGLCKACDGEGACGNVAAGIDPKDDCTATEAATCAEDGFCNGSGACRLWVNGTICGDQACNGSTFKSQDICNGSGVCSTGPTSSCCPFLCGDDACLETCTGDDECCASAYCDGAACQEKKAIGETCSGANECLSNFCVDGYCCNEACDGNCEACNLAGTEGTCSLHALNTDPDGDCGTCKVCSGVDNSCANVAAGTDPTNDCTEAAASTCDFDGTCDGAGACRNWVDGTVCLEQFCANATVHYDDTCDGGGTCSDGGSATCEPYVCNAEAVDCLDSCESDDDCFTGYYCDAGNECVPKKDNGEDCGGDNQCKSNFCVDGVCCDTACDGGCSACNIEGKLGQCNYHDNNTDPETECGLCGVCNGAGVCKAAAAGVDPKGDCEPTEQSTCGLDGTCDGNYQCRLWSAATVCLEQSCAGHIKDPAHYCDGEGVCVDPADVDCEPYVCNADGSECLFSCQSPDHCMPDYYCSGQVCLPKKDLGEPCSNPFECLSDMCADGYCCDSPCMGTCASCGLEGSLGTCSAYSAGTDPENECALCTVCGGEMGCVNVVDGEDPMSDCTASLEEDCGFDGACDGNAACRYWADGTICANQYCTDYTLTLPDLCDGTGTCIDQGTALCEPYVCDADGLACRDHCTDNVHCFEGYYCEGNLCVPKKDNGETCSAGFECKSDFCVDGYCCESACDGLCHNCSATPGSCLPIAAGTDTDDECPICEVCDGAGACEPVLAGADPEDDCEVEPEATCGSDGECNGNSACRVWSEGTICLAQYCENGVEHADDTCNGDGLDPLCMDGGTTLCSPYVCHGDGIECLTMCTSNADCVGTHWCDAPNCVLKKAIGSPCNADIECASDYCVDGVCCNNACDGPCESCNVAGQGGSCTFHANQTDPEDDCGTCALCNGGGGCSNTLKGFDPKDDCQYFDQTTCQYDGYCDGLGECAFWDETTVCDGQTCVGSTLYPSDYCDGTGACLDSGIESCCPYTCGAGTEACRNSCSVDGHCCTGFYCHGAACEAKKEDGEVCATDGQCLSGFCVDGYCCNEGCEGDCRSCAVAGSEGVCTNHTSNTDPEYECGLCRVCNGAGGCKNALAGSDAKNQCAQSLAKTCGYDGGCNGAGACAFWDDSTVCKAQMCAGSEKENADMCSGAGACVDGGVTDCCPYVCNDTGEDCRTGCSANYHCCDGYYCFSGECVAQKALGETCNGHTECLSGFCVDGFCCDTNCQLGCESCAIAGQEGTCSFHPQNTDPENNCPQCLVCSGTGNACVPAEAGSDPVNDCAAMAQTSCGYDGNCDGAGACGFWGDGTECFAQYCVGGTVFYADTCNGGGVCTDGGNLSCDGYTCDAAGLDCRTECTEQFHCAFGYYCNDASECVPKKGLGETCDSNDECSSWYCVDGYCCNGPCASQCQACNQAGSEGYCTNLANNTDPESECGPCRVCSGGGSCKNATQGTDPKDNCTEMPEWGCGYDGECGGNGSCEYWVAGTECSAQLCTGSTLYLSDSCNGAGVCVDAGTQSCTPYKCAGDGSACKTSCTTDADCVSGYYCSGAVCVAKKPNGSSCSAANECSSNYCVDGYCCNSGCAGACRACNVAGSQGTCTFYGSGTDPQAECDTCKVCNGSGACGAAEEGTDPKSECSQELPSTCGQDGVCDGDGACRQWPGGTICSDQSCSVDELTATKYCDGDGNCVSSASNCDTLVPAGWDLDQGSPFVCGETDYLVGCSGLVTFAQAKDWCSSMGGRLCTWSELAADEAAGTGCAYDSARVWSTSECQEGHYWTGAGKYSNIGLYPKQCTDGALALANVRCCADVSSCCPYQCSGKGCGTMCGGDDDCCDGYYCEAGQCQSKGNQGQTCMGDDECVTGFCVDGYCCDTACDGLCEACDLAGQEGTCSAIPNNTDPENSCPTCQVCDGNKACKDVPAGADFANDCVAQAASTCESNGLCDGAGACAVWQAGTECQPQVCSDSTLYFADQCNGDAGDPLCSDGGTTSCCPFKCNAGGTGCRESCTSNGQCCAESYCEAGACIGKKANGTGCSGPSECQSGFCVDGVCCDTACDGVCKACNVSGSTGTCTNYANNTDEESECGLCKTCNGAGACKNVTAGQDVKDDCAQQAQESCGFDGTCDGAGHCAYWPDTAQCAAASCGGTSYFPAHFCNGTGTCAEPIEESCCPYKCNGAGSDCKNSCLVDADCCSDYFCQGNACVSKKANGQTCSTNNECSSGKCVDGYCCDNWCAGACQACNVAGKLGACTNHGATTDPEGECGLCKVCDGTGACVNVPDGSDPLDECAQADVTTCGHDGTCNGGGGCRYWADTSVCADQSCAGSTQQSTSYCNGSGNCLPGATANCCPYTCTGNECRTQCDTNSECCSGFFCVANTCVATLPDGSSCSDSAQCSSGFCVDGYCCNTACAGSCEACNVAGKLGVCTLHSINTDPDNECATCNVCNGMGACVKVANGQDPLGDCVEEAPCGQDGYCDGAGVCRFWNDSTECNAQTCSESTLYLADYCDGAGLCEDNGTTSCAPYKCSGNACGTSCVSDSDCVLGYWCDTYAPGPVKECKPKLSNGELCDFANECLSGNCIDGYCCDTTCSGLCRACDIAGFEGQCTHVGNNLDPDAECGLCKACDGAGACKNATAGHDPKNECTQSLPTTCGLDGGCNGSGACRFWSVATECGDQTCTGTDLAPIDYCNGSGTCVDSPTESCCPYKCSNNNACKTSCSVDADCCSGTYYCNGSACVEKLENGDACSASSQCKSGKCVDGFCCDSWCTGTCQGCNVAGAEGACTPRASGSDPENECGNCEQCNGASACAFVPQGQDPLGDCTQEPADSCGTSGACDGAGNCEAWPSGTVCEPQTCVDALVHLPDYCDGSGLCVDSGSASCCPYKCSGDSCRTNCSTNSHCCTGYYCNSGSCITKKANGEACSAASECASGFCADGVCCDKACGGACQACNLAGFLGKCTYHAYLTDPDDDCGVCAVCNGSGACLNAAAGTDPFDDCNQQATTTCGNDGTCNGTGACRKWDSSVICAGQSCSESTLQPTDYCNGTGTCVDSGSVTCCPYDCLGDACRTSCTADVNCCTDALCKNGGACQTCDASAICPVRTSEATAAWCCDGDSCDETIELTDPASWLAPENASSYYKGSTYGSSNQFEYAGSGNAYGSYAPDRVFHFDTKNDTVGMSLKVEVWGTFDTVIWMKKSACGGGGVNVSGSYNEDGCGLANGGSCFDLKLDPGQDYWLYVDGFGTAKGDFNLKMTFTTLCHDCTCDSSYGETVSNSDDCYQAGDFCYNYTDILRVNSDTGDDANTDANDDTSWSRYYDDNLTGDHDDFNHYPETGYTYNYCDVCTDAYNACTPRHTYNDKVYRLVLPSTMNIKLRIDKTGTWSPGDYPRLYVWKGTSCPGASKEVCLSKSSSYLQWGDGGTSPTAWPVSGVRTWTAGTYWIIVDTTFISDMSTAPYRLKVDVWK